MSSSINTENQQQTPRGQWTAGAVAVFVIGLLIVVPSGLCTGVLAIGSVYSAIYYVMFTHHTAVSQVPMTIAAIASGLGTVLAIGGPFVALGIFLMVVGLRMRKRN